MNVTQLEVSPMNNKKVWTQPVVEVIDINSAKNKTPHNGASDGTYSKS